MLVTCEVCGQSFPVGTTECDVCPKKLPGQTNKQLTASASLRIKNNNGLVKGVEATANQANNAVIATGDLGIDNNSGNASAISLNINVNPPLHPAKPKKKPSPIDKPEASILNGKEIYRFFNRKQPVQQFCDIFQKHITKQDKSRVLVYIIEAAEEDCPSSFITRLTKYEVQRIHGAAIDIVSPLSELNLEMFRDEEVPFAVRRLQNELLRCFHITSIPSPPMINQEFHSSFLPVANRYSLIQINHTITAHRWHPKMPELLKLYIQGFNNLPTSCPPILLFFTVQYRPFYNMRNIRNLLESCVTSKHIAKTIIQQGVLFDEIEYCSLARLTKIHKEDVHAVLRMSYVEGIPDAINQKFHKLFSSSYEVSMSSAEECFHGC